MTSSPSIPIRVHRRLLAVTIAVALMLVIGLGGDDPDTQTLDRDRARGVKVGYLYNFVNLPFDFVRWPGHVFSQPDAPIVIGVIGRDPFEDVLDATMADKLIEGRRRIQIKRFEPLPDADEDPALPDQVRALSRCHLLFIAESERRRYPRICRFIQAAPVLTVSDIEGFCERGGMIELALRERRIVPRINRRVAERSQLRFSAKLLRLAQVVESDP